MKKDKDQNLQTRHTDIQNESHGVASRLEGVVKNVGIKPQKKEKKIS